MGRITFTEDALQEVTASYEYPDWNTKISHTGALYKKEFVDGLGRKYKTISSGEDGAQAREVIAEVLYNERGLVDHESMPHYIDEDESTGTPGGIVH